MMGNLLRELRFLVQQTPSLVALALLVVLSAASLLLGRAEIDRQQSSIDRMRAMDVTERAEIVDGFEDYGSAAYYSFYGTWDEPSNLAFTALGQRDVAPYMLRVRMLALEGQIYESDTLNPELGLSGRFDYEFVVAFLLPLFVVFLLHDLISSERESGRLPLLTATSGSGARLWVPRAGLRILAALVCVLLPFWAIGLGDAVGIWAAAIVSAIVILQTGVWSAITLFLARLRRPSSAIAAMLVSVWLVLSLLVPLVGKTVVDRVSPVVEGADISLLQRETVNDAWDLPKAATMDRFFEVHPEWSNTGPIGTWHWKWYYAFQHVGDLTAANLSTEYRRSIAERDRLSGLVAFLSPAVAVQRAMQKAAQTDVTAALAYDQRIRSYHSALREFYYPLLFTERPYTAGVLADAPLFDGQLDALPDGR